MPEPVEAAADPAPLAAQAKPVLMVKIINIDSALNIRQGPGTDYPIVGTADPGQEFIFSSSTPDWVEIEYASTTAFVYRYYTSLAR